MSEAGFRACCLVGCLCWVVLGLLAWTNKHVCKRRVPRVGASVLPEQHTARMGGCHLLSLAPQLCRAWQGGRVLLRAPLDRVVRAVVTCGGCGLCGGVAQAHCACGRRPLWRPVGSEEVTCVW